MTLSRIALIGALVAVAGVATGCELAIAAYAAVKASEDDTYYDESYAYDDTDYYYDYTYAPLDVTLEEASAEIGGVRILLTTATGEQYGTSSSFEASNGGSTWEGDFIYVDLCPIEDVMRGTTTASTFINVSACSGLDCRYWSGLDTGLEVAVVDMGDRTRIVDTFGTSEDGSTVSLTLRYTVPES
jgi:hypothetical protein